MAMNTIRKMKELIKEYWENDNIQTIAAILACVLSVVAICVSLNSNSISNQSNKISFETKEQMRLDSLAEDQGIIVINNNIVVRKTVQTYCELGSDVLCLYNLLLNDGYDDLDRTIDILLPIEIANPKQSAIFSISITNAGLDDIFYEYNKEIFEANDRLKWELDARDSWSIDERSSLVNLFLYEEETGDSYRGGFIRFKYTTGIMYVRDLVIELPYIDVRYQKINGEQIVVFNIDRGYFDIAFLTATYNSDDSNSEMGAPSKITIPLRYSYLDYNGIRYTGEMEIIITISVNHEFRSYNQYEYEIKIEYVNVTKWTKVCKV